MSASKLDRATAALASGQRYVMDGETYTFHTFADRTLAYPQDWSNLDEYAGALWSSETDHEAAYLVAWNGGCISAIDGWSARRSAIDLIHETRHANGCYVALWYSCDGFACGMIDL